MPALLETNEWVAAQFRNAGIAQVGVEQHTGSLTIPTGWSVTVHGPGPDTVLQSSMPIRTSPSISGTLNAPLVFVGAGSSAEMAGKSVQGKVAVIHKKPNPGLFFARFSLTDLIAAQPAAILVTIELPGNMMSQDSCASGNIPCFYLGGADGQFLEAALAAVDRTGAAQLTASVQLTMTTYPSAVVSNAYAFIPGMNNRRDRRGENIMISGIIITGTDPLPLLIRALGPSLSNAGLANPLQDPILELHDGNGSLIASNDNWKDTQQTEIEATGLAPIDDREAAMVITVFPGFYTAVVAGAGGTTGLGFVQFYSLASPIRELDPAPIIKRRR